ncbi:hypothetical protein AB0B44_43130, partial [Streptomyces sp. NPDC041003]
MTTDPLTTDRPTADPLTTDPLVRDPLTADPLHTSPRAAGRLTVGPEVADALGPDAAARFTALLERALGLLGGPRVTLAALGFGDAFTRPAPGAEDDAAVPVHLYGHQAVLGPPGGCARCLDGRSPGCRSHRCRASSTSCRGTGLRASRTPA